jgi:reactive chlorine resistance protein C
MFALPIWEPGSGGFPWLNATGSFLIKDVTLLGVSLVVLGESLARLHGEAAQAPTS